MALEQALLYRPAMQDIPTIDLSPLIAGAPESQETVAAIAAACRNLGFFQVIGHDITVPETDRLWRAAQAFFALPMRDKQNLSRSEGNPLGYFDRELTRNARDLKEIIDFGPGRRGRASMQGDGENRWPGEKALPGFRAVIGAWQESCTRLSHCIMGAFSLGLGEKADRLDRYFAGRHTSFLRLNHYPVADLLTGDGSGSGSGSGSGDGDDGTAPPPLGDMALHQHSDAGGLTILLQDAVGGLEVQVQESWIDVAPRPGALVVNIGDMSQVWSNGQYRAALHRVRPVPGVARYSVAFFYNPAFDAIVEPLPATRNGGSRYKPVSWGAFRGRRAAGDYADYGSEIQISDYLTTEGRNI